jgi:hypothetical protein
MGSGLLQGQRDAPGACRASYPGYADKLNEQCWGRAREAASELLK